MAMAVLAGSGLSLTQAAKIAMEFHGIRTSGIVLNDAVAALLKTKSGPATNSFVNPSSLDCELINRLKTSFVKPDEGSGACQLSGDGDVRRGFGSRFGNILKFGFEPKNMVCHIFWPKAKRPTERDRSGKSEQRSRI
jgi:hypothetical protein